MRVRYLHVTYTYVCMHVRRYACKHESSLSCVSACIHVCTHTCSSAFRTLTLTRRHGGYCGAWRSCSQVGAMLCAERLHIICGLLLNSAAHVDARCTTDICWRFVLCKATGAAKQARSAGGAKAPATLPVFAVAVRLAATV